jgi:hypothetical protein
MDFTRKVNEFVTEIFCKKTAAMKKVIASVIASKSVKNFARIGFLQSWVVAALLVLGLLSGCSHVDTAERRVVMIFVDVSLSSLPERDNYKRYIEQIISSLKPGDVVAGGKIIDLTIAEFTPIFNIELPAFDFWNDNRTRHQKIVGKLTARMFASIDSVLESRGKIEKSEIINSFLICDQFMRNKNGKKTLVILSDMIECSSDFNFDKDDLTPAYIDRAMQTLRGKGRIPNLRNVDVWIVGAYAQNTEKYFAVQNFWNRYVKETGAHGRSYSHTLLDFD